MEKVVLCKMRQYIGWTGDDGDGILAPGQCRAVSFISNGIDVLSISARLSISLFCCMLKTINGDDILWVTSFVILTLD